MATSFYDLSVPTFLQTVRANPHVREHIRPFVADKAQTAQFLASKGLALTDEGRDLFLDAVGDEFVPAIQLLILLC